jgi:hypothetical protein
VEGCCSINKVGSPSGEIAFITWPGLISISKAERAFVGFPFIQGEIPPFVVTIPEDRYLPTKGMSPRIVFRGIPDPGSGGIGNFGSDERVLYIHLRTDLCKPMFKFLSHQFHSFTLYMFGIRLEVRCIYTNSQSRIAQRIQDLSQPCGRNCWQPCGEPADAFFLSS